MSNDFFNMIGQAIIEVCGEKIYENLPVVIQAANVCLSDKNHKIRVEQNPGNKHGLIFIKHDGKKYYWYVFENTQKRNIISPKARQSLELVIGCKMEVKCELTKYIPLENVRKKFVTEISIRIKNFLNGFQLLQLRRKFFLVLQKSSQCGRNGVFKESDVYTVILICNPNMRERQMYQKRRKKEFYIVAIIPGVVSPKEIGAKEYIRNESIDEKIFTGLITDITDYIENNKSLSECIAEQPDSSNMFHVSSLPVKETSEITVKNRIYESSSYYVNQDLSLLKDMQEERKKLKHKVTFKKSLIYKLESIASQRKTILITEELEKIISKYLLYSSNLKPRKNYHFAVLKSDLFKRINIFSETQETDVYMVTVSDAIVEQLFSCLKAERKEAFMPYRLIDQFIGIFFKHPWDFPELKKDDLQEKAKNLLSFFNKYEKIFKRKKMFDTLTYGLDSEKYFWQNLIMKSYIWCLKNRTKKYSVNDISPKIMYLTDAEKERVVQHLIKNKQGFGSIMDITYAVVAFNKRSTIDAVTTKLTTEDVCRQNVDSINSYFTTKTVGGKDLVDYVREKIAVYIRRNMINRDGIHEFVVNTGKEVVGKHTMELLQQLDLTKLCVYAFVPQNDFVFNGGKSLKVLVKEEAPADTTLISVFGRFNSSGIFEIIRIQAGTFIIHTSSKNQTKYMVFNMQPLPRTVSKRRRPGIDDVRISTREEMAKYNRIYTIGVTEIIDNLILLPSINYFEIKNCLKKNNIDSIQNKFNCPAIDVTAAFGYSS
jgi:hypothetical protein